MACVLQISLPEGDFCTLSSQEQKNSYTSTGLDPKINLLQEDLLKESLCHTPAALITPPTLFEAFSGVHGAQNISFDELP